MNIYYIYLYFWKIRIIDLF
ncbi:hypothetical protein PFFCH_01147 [Plasmodium falciparum FCH/4]|uniref:Uncharacterized protein n=1 Tax=Plasmodium falciparum FCH/4 TaxID=1036724 RepID=A0A024VSL4_PLAFA|nr:hypothetical protein PFFCH_01147 [Plasmodium falciparum FCH/4]